MARDHYIAPTAPTADAIAVRLGASGAANNLTTAEVGKFAKLTAESGYDLCAVGNKIEAVIFAVELAPQNQFTVGSVVVEGRINVTFDGLEATPGVGVVTLGSYVVTGTPVAKDTALTAYPAVCKATNQPGTTVVSTVGAADTAAAIKTVVDAALVKVADAQANSVFAWRVVSLGTAGTGAVATTGVIERVTC